MSCVIKKNIEKKGVELYFDKHPGNEAISKLKNEGFKWHTGKKCWYAKENDKSLNVAKAFSDNKNITRSIVEAKKIKESKENKQGIKKGDIFCMSWGYDQTNIDYFQVVDTKESMVKIKEIAQERVGSETGSDLVSPKKDSFVLNSMWTEDNGVWRLPKKGYQDQVYFKVDSTKNFTHAYKVNPGVVNRQTASGYGH